jgi:endonuclease G
MPFRLPRRTLSLLVLLLVIIALEVFLPNTPADNTPTQIEQPTTAPPLVAPSSAQTTANRNLLLGNPSAAVHDSSQPANYLIERPQYTVSYNRDRATPNWVSWQLTQSDLGSAQRSNDFSPDKSLPSGWFQVQTDDYTNSGYDRGHMCPSADRTATPEDNDATFILTNVVPQAPDNNRVTWEHLEAFSRSLVTKGHVLYIVAGVDGSNGAVGKGKITVPAFTWKIVVVAPKGDGSLATITAPTPVLAVRIPNDKDAKLGDWDQYRVTVAAIETATGNHFFGNLPADVQKALKGRIDPPPTN